MHFIEREVLKVIKKCGTRDPYEICQALKITCKTMELHPEINGIYQYVERNKFIYINSLQTETKQISTCYHELGHACVHENYNCTFLKTHTFLNTNRFEKEAELATSCFYIPDINEILKFKGLTLEEISHEVNVPKEYIELRLQHAENIGHFKNLFIK